MIQHYLKEHRLNEMCRSGKGHPLVRESAYLCPISVVLDSGSKQLLLADQHLYRPTRDPGTQTRALVGSDHYHNLFVWSGKAVVGGEYASAREQLKRFLLERAETRFPMPQLHMLSEDDSIDE
jgi:hypothetical protein